MIKPSSVVVGSYNVENLFAKEDIPEGARMRPKYAGAQAALADNLKLADADVVALQEVSSKATLENFLRRNDLAAMYPHVAHVVGNSDRGINVAIISKYPFETIVTHKDEKFPLADGSGESQFSRDLLRADVNLDGVPGAELSIYTTHSKSRRPADPGEASSDTQRLSEGQAIRSIVEREMKPYPGRLYVVTGDLNDNTDDKSVQAMLNPKQGEPWLDSLDHLPDNQRNTWPSNPARGGRFGPEQFDHILYPKSVDGQLVESKIHRYDESPDGKHKDVSANASDHLMISAEFRLAP